MMSVSWSRFSMELYSNVPTQTNIYALTEDTPEILHSKLSKIDNILRTSSNEEKKSRRRRITLATKTADGWSRHPTPGSIGLENFW